MPHAKALRRRKENTKKFLFLDFSLRLCAFARKIVLFGLLRPGENNCFGLTDKKIALMEGGQ